MRSHGKTMSMLGMLVLIASLMQYASQVAAQSTKINGPLTEGRKAHSIVITPDSSRVIYIASQETYTDNQIFVAPIDGGTYYKIGDPNETGSHSYLVTLTPDGTRVLYRAEHDTPLVQELYSVSINGGTVTKLNPPFTVHRDLHDFSISPDGSLVVYTSDVETNGRTELYSMPIGGGTVTKLNFPLTAGEGVRSYAISADNSRVVFKIKLPADPDWGPDPNPACDFGECNAEVHELYSVPIEGGTVTKLNLPLPDWGYVWEFKISPDSTRVVYRAEQDTDRISELYSVPTEGGTVTKLNAPLVSGGNVSSSSRFGISPNSTRVVYQADQDTDGVDELYSVPIGGGTVVKLNAPLLSGGEVQTYTVSADSSRVVYNADQDTNNVQELYSVPIDGGTATRLNAPLVSGGDVLTYRFGISPDNTRVVYQADQDTDGVNEFYSVPIDGGTVTKLNAPLVSGGNVDSLDTLFSPDSWWVLYHADQDTDGIRELYRVPTIGGIVTKINNPLVIIPGENLPTVRRANVLFSPDSSRVLFEAGQTSELEVYSSILPPPPDPDNVYVDFEYGGAGAGTLENPFDTLVEGIAMANAGATIHLVPGTSSETFTGASAVSKALYLFNDNPGGGPVIIGQSEARSAQGSALQSGFVSTGPTRE